MVRLGALRAMERLPIDVRWTTGKAALSDPIRAVRMEAASLLAEMPLPNMSNAERTAWDKAAQEYVAAKRFNADRAEERANLGRFYVKQGKADLAEQDYLAAIKLSPRQVPPRVISRIFIGPQGAREKRRLFCARRSLTRPRPRRLIMPRPRAHPAEAICRSDEQLETRSRT